jgi:CMP-N-acetylneuraminic acid synthetase
MKILVLIPAKLDSTRLPKKNLRKLFGKTLVEHSIEYAKQSKYAPTIVISSESPEVWEIATQNNVQWIQRPERLLKDAEVTDVYIDYCNTLVDNEYDLVVALQPDNPNRSNSFDECIDYFIENNYDDLVTISPMFKRSGSLRIFKFMYLKYGMVSKRIGCKLDTAADIHYEEDLNSLQTII